MEAKILSEHAQHYVLDALLRGVTFVAIWIEGVLAHVLERFDPVRRIVCKRIERLILAIEVANRVRVSFSALQADTGDTTLPGVGKLSCGRN